MWVDDLIIQMSQSGSSGGETINVNLSQWKIGINVGAGGLAKLVDQMLGP